MQMYPNPDREKLLNELRKMLAWKKSRKYYAGRLGIDEETVDGLIEELQSQNKFKWDSVKPGEFPMITEVSEEDTPKIEEEGRKVKFEEDFKNDTAYIEYIGSREIKTKEDLIQECNIDLDKWDISRLTCNAWGKLGNQNFQVKAQLIPKTKAKIFQESFVEFLKTYSPTRREIQREKIVESPKVFRNKSCLVYNKQDAHLNKFDVHGDNSIYNRFQRLEALTKRELHKIDLISDIEKIVYILGSDQFNSEWTSCTTKGTPQQNILTYHKAFELICEHEIAIIEALMLHSNEVEILYVPGNHDEYVGWHMVNWLKAYFKEVRKIRFDDRWYYRKYIKYSNTALMFNHGDMMKPQQLAQVFPVEFSKQWSNCNSYYIFTGDKHHEMHADFNGIKFYGIPALSKSKSFWDEKKGFNGTKAELTLFLIEDKVGMTHILKYPI